MTKKPNIVLFIPDSYRGDVVGHQDNAGAVTPNLDALVASDAVSYSNAFAQNPGGWPRQLVAGVAKSQDGFRTFPRSCKTR